MLRQVRWVKDGKEEYVVCMGALLFLVQMAIHLVELVDAFVRLKKRMLGKEVKEESGVSTKKEVEEKSSKKKLFIQALK